MKFLFIFLSLFVSTLLFSQAPEGINYQAVMRNSSGNLVTNSTVAIRVQIRQGSATGTAVYQERQSIISSSQGLINMVIGAGTPQVGTFNNINWAVGPFFVNLAVDFSNGVNYQDFGTQQLMSVPYALYAKKSGAQLNQWGYGNTVPVNSLGVLGDFYLDVVTGNVYYKNSATTWVLTGNIKGPVGPSGAIGATGPQGAQGAQGIQGAPGAQGTQGVTGVNGSNGQNTLVKTTTETAGANCTTGGIKIEYGLDANSNGTLDANEINASLTKYVCNGAVGATGQQGPQGIQGLTGAQGIQGVAGTNGTNGADGKNTLAKTTTEAAGTNCTTGGVKIEYGLDANNNGTLDVSEINATLTRYVCNGAVGATGAQGIQGLTGAQGIQGVAGATGATGLQGPIGLTGPTGAQGIQGIQGATGAAGTNGTNGTNGADGKNTLAKTTTEAAGANCTTGGVKIEYGLDANNNGTLDISEVNATLTKYVCNGAVGATGAQGIQGLTGAQGIQGVVGSTGAAGKNTLAKTTTEAAGANCTTGGVKIEYGLDANSNGTLDISEINAALTKYVCNGALGATGAQGAQGIQGVAGTNGAQGIQGVAGAAGTNGTDGKNTLAKTTTEAAGANCTTGGVKIEYGLDANNNGTLDLSEINASLTKYVCNGAVGATGATGAQGPQGIQGVAGPTGATGAQGPIGLTGPAGATGTQGAQGPAGTNGTNGTNGADGQNTLVKTTTEAAGANCTTGGVKIEYGLDANNNGTLDVSEVNASLTKYVCNGAVGATGAQGPIGLTGPTGATGAQGIQGIAGPTGATGAQGPIGLTGPAGATGAQGAQGPTGTNGTNGTNGADGKNTLVKTTTEAAGANCITGGIKIEYGLDANSNGVLDVSEINASLTKYICNGAVGATGAQGIQGIQGVAGTQGAAGANGTNGLNALIKTTTEPAGANCTNGGTKIETGLDANGNGVLDVGEVNASQTQYVCNGLSGTNTGNNGSYSGSSIISNDTISPLMKYIGNGQEGAFDCSSFSGVLSGEHFYTNFKVPANCTLQIGKAQTTIIHVRDTCFINGVIDGNGGLVSAYSETRDWIGAAGGCSIICTCGGQTCGYGDFSWTYSPEPLNQLLGYGHTKTVSKWSGDNMTLNNIRVASFLGLKINGYSSLFSVCGPFSSTQTAQGGSGLIIICKNLVFNGQINLNGSSGGGNGAGGAGGGSLIISTDNSIQNLGVVSNLGGTAGCGGTGSGGKGVFYFINF